ncbi:MAG: TrkA family potassium uptake protein [Victivallales bacterium]|nr:TrkA family potassium uptake protein [Victivallales bacterium]
MSKHNQIAVIGLGTFGLETATSLMKAGLPVCAVDLDADLIENVKDSVTTAMVLDSTQERALIEAEIQNMDVVVVAIGAGGIENSIMTTALLKQLNPEIHVIARSTSKLHGRILKQVGADEVINPEFLVAQRVAQHISNPAILDAMTLPDNFRIAEVPVPPSFVGHTIVDLAIRNKFSLNVLAIERAKSGSSAEAALKKNVNSGTSVLEIRQTNPDDYRVIVDFDPMGNKLQWGDCLMVMGSEQNICLLMEL